MQHTDQPQGICAVLKAGMRNSQKWGLVRACSSSNPKQNHHVQGQCTSRQRLSKTRINAIDSWDYILNYMKLRGEMGQFIPFIQFPFVYTIYLSYDWILQLRRALGSQIEWHVLSYGAGDSRECHQYWNRAVRVNLQSLVFFDITCHQILRS